MAKNRIKIKYNIKIGVTDVKRAMVGSHNPPFVIGRSQMSLWWGWRSLGANPLVLGSRPSPFESYSARIAKIRTTNKNDTKNLKVALLAHAGNPPQNSQKSVFWREAPPPNSQFGSHRGEQTAKLVQLPRSAF